MLACWPAFCNLSLFDVKKNFIILFIVVFHIELFINSPKHTEGFCVICPLENSCFWDQDFNPEWHRQDNIW